MANNDKIYEAYHGSMGAKFQEITRNRIAWIVDNAIDKKDIIDIGCSQGITTFLLAEEGKNVLGIDIQPEAIEYAENLLNTEYSHLSQNIEFICSDFEKYEAVKKYDCIIATEVIEHLKNPNSFVKKMNTTLNENGKIIISVPFGVNNHPDHFTTFYLTSLYEMISEYFDILSLDYHGHWIGLIASHKGSVKNPYTINNEQIKALEEAFLVKNTELVEQVESQKQYIETVSQKYNSALENYDTVKSWHTASQEKNKVLTEKLNESNNYILQVHDELDEQIAYMNELKLFIKKLEAKNSYLRTENDNYHRKLSRITDTWYGKFAIKCYKFLLKVKRKLKR